jgi:hypothetical protein
LTRYKQSWGFAQLAIILLLLLLLLLLYSCGALASPSPPRK